MRYLARMLSGVSLYASLPSALLILMTVAGADVADLCLLAPDKNGNYSPAESAKYVRCLREKAEQGDMFSQHELGLLYSVGDLTPQDYEEAAKWFRRAADQGHATSQFHLGAMYKSGEGVPKNIVLSQMWEILSAAQGNVYARLARDIAGQEMTPAQIAEAQKLAREWKPKPER
jgi:TPR repeat protein